MQLSTPTLTPEDFVTRWQSAILSDEEAMLRALLALNAERAG